MGSMITLGLGKMEIDWGKNNVFRNHSALFQGKDIKQIPYYYIDLDTDLPIIEMKEGLARKLSSVKNRLDLLGYSIYSIKQYYNDALKKCEDFGYEIDLPFSDFYNMLTAINIPKVNTPSVAIESHENGYDLGEYVKECILGDIEIKSNIPITYLDSTRREWSNPAYDLGIFFENLDPYILLRILAENHNNDEIEVQWRFADVVDGGWVTREDIVKPLSVKEKILIVTEGSSDTFIIKKAVNQLYPDISDFFHFIDMEANYPFTGVGNLYNFCLGLIRINIVNSIIAIFDNDTIGIEKYTLLRTISMPNTFLVTTLPDCDDFTNFHTYGPQGDAYENINGKAVSIECFLDFKSVKQEPTIRWTSFSSKLNQYHGELINKEKYVRAFKNCCLTDDIYNSKKLISLVEYLLQQWILANNQH